MITKMNQIIFCSLTSTSYFVFWIKPNTELKVILGVNLRAEIFYKFFFSLFAAFLAEYLI